MKNFKIEVPDEKVSFILELFKHIEFAKCKSVQSNSDQKPQVSLEDDVVKQASKKLPEGKNDGGLAHLKDLRDTINSLQKSRDTRANYNNNALFRFPHGSDKSAIEVISSDHLTSRLESYYRTNVIKMHFKENQDEPDFNMDAYKVYITLSDNSEMMCGYCDKILL